jgi:methionine synthase II (cobalamin-independent)
MASERDKDPVLKMIGEHSRDDANGVPQTCYIGLINPGNPRVESAQEVADALIRAANFIPRERLGATDYAREVAFQKISNRVEGTRMAAEKLGIGNRVAV